MNNVVDKQRVDEWYAGTMRGLAYAMDCNERYKWMKDSLMEGIMKSDIYTAVNTVASIKTSLYDMLGEEHEPWRGVEHELGLYVDQDK